MARQLVGGPGLPHGEDFSFVSPVVKFLLFFFNMLFWMISMVMVAVGVYARLMKHAGEQPGGESPCPHGKWWGGGVAFF
uniref:Uncharacterized protein n=1 Tax=Sphenodon punctatus TaxID=8508 RepID=A0A8D0L161_SPHPU